MSAASDAAKPAASNAITGIFQNSGCEDAPAIQIPTPHSAPIKDPRKIRVNAPATPTSAPNSDSRG